MQLNALLLFAGRPVTEHFASCTGVVTWSVTVSREHRLRLIEHRAQRKIFGPKREEVRRK
jgi:glutamine amidotransferase PdxT